MEAVPRLINPQKWKGARRRLVTTLRDTAAPRGRTGSAQLSCRPFPGHRGTCDVFLGWEAQSSFSLLSTQGPRLARCPARVRVTVCFCGCGRVCTRVCIFLRTFPRGSCSLLVSGHSPCRRMAADGPPCPEDPNSASFLQAKTQQAALEASLCGPAGRAWEGRALLRALRRARVTC